MIPKLFKGSMLRYMSERPLRFIQTVPTSKADGILKQVYRQAAQEFFIGGPITVHSPSPELTACLWVAGRETIVVKTAVSRGVKEAIATAVSQINKCPYCVDMHASMTHANSQHDVADAIVNNNLEWIDDPHVRDIIEWVLQTRTPGSPILASAPFSTAETPEIVGTAFFFHYVNRVVSTFLEGSALDLPLGLGQSKNLLRRIFGWELARDVAVSPKAGLSLDLIPQAPATGSFGWAKGNDAIYRAFTSWEFVIDREASRVIGTKPMAVVRDELATWEGEDKPLGRAWLHEATNELTAGDIVVTRLLLLVAFAPYAITQKDVDAWRKETIGDKDLVTAVCWAAFQTALRIMEWAAPVSQDESSAEHSTVE